MSLTYDDLDRAVRSALVAARTNAGLTQRALAMQLGRVHSFVAKIENGTRRTTVSDFIRIAQAIQTDPIELLAQVVTRVFERTGERD